MIEAFLYCEYHVSFRMIITSSLSFIDINDIRLIGHPVQTQKYAGCQMRIY